LPSVKALQCIKHDGADPYFHYRRDWCFPFREITLEVLKLTLRGIGFIGGSILAHVLSHKDRAAFQISALLRSEDKARKLQEQFGVKAVVGSTADTDKLTGLAAAADIVFDTVSRKCIS